MSKIKINKEYKDKIKEFEEHQDSLDNKIQKTIEVLRKSDSETIFEILAEMNNIFKKHFSIEERILKNFNYPEFNTHTSEHKSFLKRAQSYRRRTEDDHKTLTNDVINFLKYWQIYHSDGSDKKYMPYIRLQIFFNSNPL